MKKTLLVLLITLPILLGACSSAGGKTASNDKPAAKGPVVVLQTQKGPNEIAVNIADTPAERTKGLMFVKYLPQGQGMFFVFDSQENLQFWMKNTLIPLDMVFFDDGYNVVHIAKNVQPCKADPCAVYPSEKPAKYVLEYFAGSSDKIGLKDGDKAQLII